MMMNFLHRPFKYKKHFVEVEVDKFTLKTHRIYGQKTYIFWGFLMINKTVSYITTVE